MNVGIIGLGRMGNAIAYRALKAGFTIIGFDYDQRAQKEAAAMGVEVVDSLEAMAQKVGVIWLMVPVARVDEVLDEIIPYMKAGDIIIDGGNSYYEDSIRRAAHLLEHDITFLDCGTSGGIVAKERGFCLMVGGDEKVYKKMVPFFKAIAASEGYERVGKSGTGHYVKMVHNGIEYGLLQAYAEGFTVIKDGTFKKDEIDLEKLSALWNHGSIIRSFILELTHDIFKKDQELKNISGEIEQHGTGAWTAQEAHKHAIATPVLDKSLEVRGWSMRTGGNYTTKLIAMLRHAFGGHAVKKTKES